MATAKYGVKAGEWWKHLRKYGKRDFWHRMRRLGKRLCAES